MFLKKNLWGLFFFFVWGTIFSQWGQLEKSNETFVEYAFMDTNAIDFKVIPTTSANYHVELNMDDEYNILLDSLTITEKKSEKFRVNILNINSPYSDYAPSFYNGELVFASSRSINSMSKSFDEVSNQPFLDLYTTAKKSDKQRIKKLKGTVNTKFHESSVAFSKDQKTIYFTRNNYSKKKSRIHGSGTVLLKIYKAEYDNGRWKNVEELPFNSDEYSIAHPAISPDGKSLYFASDMPGSYGKSDLYVVTINEDGSYGEPKNLGESINTDGRETFPYVSDQGRLFFASDGHAGMGGLDIFMALPNQHGSTVAYNLGNPINSSKDDFTFIINEEYKIGYFSSNRNGSKEDDDIYGFRQLKPFPELLRQKVKGIQKLERILLLKPYQEITTLD